VEIVVDAKVTGSPEGSPLQRGRKRDGERGREKEGLERELRDKSELTGGDAEGVGSTLRRVLQTEYMSIPLPRTTRSPLPHSRARRCPPALRSVWNTILDCYRIKRLPQERPLNIDSPSRTIRNRVAFYSSSVVGVDHVEEMSGQRLNVDRWRIFSTEPDVLSFRINDLFRHY